MGGGERVRVVVASDRVLSSVALVDALSNVPNCLVVGQVDSLQDARRYCEKDEVDAVVAEAATVICDSPLTAALLAQLAIEGLGSGILPDRVLVSLHEKAGLAFLQGEADRPWPGRTRGIDELSDREHQVFTLLGLGLSNRQMARHLEITERTIKTHVGHVLAKLGLESRLQAGLTAFACLAACSEKHPG